MVTRAGSPDTSTKSGYSDAFSFLEPVPDEELPLLGSKEWDDKEWLSHVLKEVIGLRDGISEAIQNYYPGLSDLINDTQEGLEANIYDPTSEGVNKAIISRILEFKDFYDYLDEFKYLNTMGVAVWQEGRVSSKIYAAWKRVKAKGYMVIEEDHCMYFNPAKKKWVSSKGLDVNRPHPTPIRSPRTGTGETHPSRPSLISDDSTSLSEESHNHSSNMSDPSYIKIPSFNPSPQAYLDPTSMMQPPPSIANPGHTTPIGI